MLHINLDLYEDTNDILDTIDELSDLKSRLDGDDVYIIEDAISILEQIANEGEY